MKQLQGSISISLIRFTKVLLVCNIPTSSFYTLLMSKKMHAIHIWVFIYFQGNLRNFQSIGTWCLHRMKTFCCIKNPKKYFANVKFPWLVLVETNDFKNPIELCYLRISQQKEQIWLRYTYFVWLLWDLRRTRRLSKSYSARETMSLLMMW